MNYRIELLPPVKVAYLRNVGPYGSLENFALMAQFKEWIVQNNFEAQVKQTGILAIAQDNPARTPPEDCRFDLLLQIAEDFEPQLPVKAAYFSGGSYAVVEVKHTQAAIQAFWQELPSFIAKQQLQLKKLPIIERYKSSVGAKEAAEFLLPLKE